MAQYLLTKAQIVLAERYKSDLEAVESDHGNLQERFMAHIWRFKRNAASVQYNHVQSIFRMWLYINKLDCDEQAYLQSRAGSSLAAMLNSSGNQSNIAWLRHRL